MAEPIKMPCKEQQCKEEVTYEREVVRGFRPSRSGSRTIVVYLTCPADHTHRYEIERSSP